MLKKYEFELKEVVDTISPLVQYTVTKLWGFFEYFILQGVLLDYIAIIATMLPLMGAVTGLLMSRKAGPRGVG